MTKSQLAPWGELIEAARKASNLSIRRAAENAGISEGRWRQITRGSQRVRGQLVDDPGPDATVARIARSLRIAPEALAKAGRPEAAEILARLQSAGEDAPDPLDSLIKIRDDIDGVIAQMRQLRRA